MAHATFDTLQFTETLKAAGIPEHQARAEVQAISLAFSQVIEKQVATKTDISAVKEELKEDISAVREELYTVKEELKEDISAVKEELKEDVHAVKEDIHRLDGKIDSLDTELIGKIDANDAKVSGKINLLSWMVGISLIISLAMLPMVVNILLRLPG